jgi:hypothetical protein
MSIGGFGSAPSGDAQRRGAVDWLRAAALPGAHISHFFFGPLFEESGVAQVLAFPPGALLGPLRCLVLSAVTRGRLSRQPRRKRLLEVHIQVSKRQLDRPLVGATVGLPKQKRRAQSAG